MPLIEYPGDYLLLVVAGAAGCGERAQRMLAVDIFMESEKMNILP